MRVSFATVLVLYDSVSWGHKHMTISRTRLWSQVRRPMLVLQHFLSAVGHVKTCCSIGANYTAKLGIPLDGNETLPVKQR